MSESPDLISKLIAEKLAHTIDLMRAEVRELRNELAHQEKFYGQAIARLERDAADHEQRIRLATEGVTQFKQWSGLASGGSAIMSIVALLKAFLGGG